MKKVLYFILFILIVVLGLYLYFIAGNQLRAWRGNIKGNDFVKEVYGDYSVAGHSCQGEDSDNNGYITCDFRLKSNTLEAGSVNAEKVISLQCPTFWKSFMGTSCKQPGFIINQQ